MRLDLRDGQWAELRERINHGTDKHLKRTWRQGKSDIAYAFDIDTELGRAFVSAWSVRDIDGISIALTDADAIERLPDDIADAIASEAARLWTGATVPNEPTPPPSDDSP